MRAYSSYAAWPPPRRRFAGLAGLSVCVALALVLVAAQSRAAPPVLDVTAEGDCPDLVTLSDALRAHGCVLGPSAWHTRIWRGAGATLLELRNSAGQMVLERQIPSDDCAAVAEAAALIIEAYFVEIGVLPRARDDARSASAPPAPASETSRPTPAAAEPVAAPTPAASPRASAPPAARSRGPAPRKFRARRREASSSASANLGWHIAAGVGPRAQTPDLHFSGAAELGFGLDLRSPDLSAELMLESALPTVLLARPNRVRRWPSHALVRVGARLGSAPVTLPWVGVGVSAVRVRALDLPDAERHWVWSALAGLGIDAWWPLGRSWFAVSGLGCALYASRESYEIHPDGRIGLGPRVDCGATLGAAWAWPRADGQSRRSADRRSSVRSP